MKSAKGNQDIEPNMMDKIVILAAGRGTRMQREDASVRLTAEQASMAAKGLKALIPINGQPFLNYSLSALAEAGYHEICLVIGPDHSAVRQYYSGVRSRRLVFDFAMQEQPLGGADALLAAASFAGDDPFLVINCDNYYPPEVLSAIRRLDSSGLVGFRRDALLKGGRATAEKIANCALLETDSSGRLVNIIEKPEAELVDRMPDPVWLSMTCWRFGPSIFEACGSIGLSPRGEYEIPDAVMYAINFLDEEFRMIPSDALVLDLSRRANIAPVEKRLEGVEVNL